MRSNSPLLRMQLAGRTQRAGNLSRRLRQSLRRPAHVIHSNWCGNQTRGVYTVLDSLRPTTCCFSPRLRVGCLIWHEKKEGGGKKRKKRICSDTLDGRCWRKKRKVCSEPIKSLARSEIVWVSVGEKRRTTGVEISSPRHSVSQSNHSDSPSVSYSHSQTPATFLKINTHTVRGGGCVKLN